MKKYHFCSNSHELFKLDKQLRESNCTFLGIQDDGYEILELWNCYYHEVKINGKVLSYPRGDDAEAPAGDNIRVLVVEKNRNGPSGVKSYWQMLDSGLVSVKQK